MEFSCEEASKRLGVPEAQLKRWAAQRQAGIQAGPPFTGSYFQPKYDSKDLADWRGAPLAEE